MQVGEVHPVAVYDPYRSNAGPGQIERHRRTHTSRTHTENPRLKKFFLAARPHFGQDDLAGVALEVFFAQQGSGNQISSLCRTLAFPDFDHKILVVPPVIIKTGVFIVRRQDSQFLKFLFDTGPSQPLEKRPKIFVFFFAFLIEFRQFLNGFWNAAGRQSHHLHSKPGHPFLGGSSQQELIVRDLTVTEFSIGSIETQRGDMMLST